MKTLPDLLRDGLAVVFVGINPSLYSAARGHYFARPGNRFWPAFSRSGLSARAREALRVEALRPEHDRALLAHGFGFTDLVKRATVRAAEIEPQEMAAAVAAVARKLERYRPKLACFHGITGYRAVHGVVGGAAAPQLGLQRARIGPTRLFVVPNPSGANAHTSPAEQTRWYDQVAAWLGGAP